MTKYILTLILLASVVNASTKNIEKRIQNNKQILKKNESKHKKTDFLVKILAKQISNQNKELTKLEKDIEENKKESRKRGKQY